MLAAVEAMLLRFNLLTDLTLPGEMTTASGAGPSLVGHIFRGIRYEFLGGRLPVFISRLVDKRSLVNAETEPR